MLKLLELIKLFLGKLIKYMIAKKVKGSKEEKKGVSANIKITDIVII